MAISLNEISAFCRKNAQYKIFQPINSDLGQVYCNLMENDVSGALWCGSFFQLCEHITSFKYATLLVKKKMH